MGKKLHLDMAAEQEANDIGRKFMNSTDVVGDMSRAYGADLSSVKIHTDSAAAGMAEQRGVDAFSTGKDVFFARDAFDKNNPESRGLLAHELSHSLQQGVGGGLGGMQQSAPLGAEQGGLLTWFRDRKARKANRKMMELERENTVSDVLDGRKVEANDASLSKDESRYLTNMQDINKKRYDYIQAYGAEGMDKNGYMLPEDVAYSGRGKYLTTRFTTKEGRDAYVEVSRNPQLLNDKKVRDSLLGHFEKEMPEVFKQTENLSQQEYEQKVLRGENYGATRLLARLYDYHATKNDEKILNAGAANFSFTPFTQEEENQILADGSLSLAEKDERISKGRARAKNADVSQQFDQISEIVEQDDELMDLMDKQAEIFYKDGKNRYTKETADTQVVSDFILRGVSPHLARRGPNEKAAASSMMRQMAFPTQKGATNFLGLLRRRRDNKGQKA